MTAPFKERLADGGPLYGAWIASGSAVVAEIVARAGFDWLLVDGEHAPNDLRSILAQLQAIAAHAVTPVVRLPVGDTVLIKQHLDIGAQTLLVPMVETAEQAEGLVRATRYPPHGVRGVGSGFARASGWGGVVDYLDRAGDLVTLLVQAETAKALDNVESIAAVDGVDGIFVGPADLAASLGHLGRPDHPDVVARVTDAIARVVAAGKPVGVNAFAETAARAYVDAGATFVAVTADVTLLVRGSARAAATYVSGTDRGAGRADGR